MLRLQRLILSRIEIEILIQCKGLVINFKMINNKEVDSHPPEAMVMDKMDITFILPQAIQVSQLKQPITRAMMKMSKILIFNKNYSNVRVSSS